MGSYDLAVMSGFVCRLCSDLSQDVTHVYSDKGRALKLPEKINLTPICVKLNDKLPKTVCNTCIGQLNAQYHLITQILKSQETFYKDQKSPQDESTEECLLHSSDSPKQSTSSDEPD